MAASEEISENGSDKQIIMIIVDLRVLIHMYWMLNLYIFKLRLCWIQNTNSSILKSTSCNEFTLEDTAIFWRWKGVKENSSGKFLQYKQRLLNTETALLDSLITECLY